MSAPSPSQGAPAATGRYKRKVRNYLLNPRFQLKYTGLLVLVAVLLSAILGQQLWVSNRAVISQSHQTLEQGKETVRRGQKMVEESKKVSEVVAMNIARDPEYAENPELAALFKADSEKRDKELIEEQKRLEQDARQLEQQASNLTAQQQRTMFLLFGGLTLLVIAIGFTGIIFTHKIAGPVYKMSLLHKKVGEGKLRIETGLRKGDELQDFFVTFVSMVDQIRALHVQQTDRLEAVVKDLEGNVSAEQLRPLRELHQDMRARLDK